jgi:hypothetical protein
MPESRRKNDVLDKLAAQRPAAETAIIKLVPTFNFLKLLIFST